MELAKPFFEPACFVPQEEAVNAVVLLHEAGGVEQVTMSAVARQLKCTRAAVHQTHGGKAAFLVSLVTRFSYRWRDWTRDTYGLPVPIQLPRDDVERLGVLTWATLRTIASAEARAGRPDAWDAVRHTHDLERWRLSDVIRKVTGERPADSAVEAALALAEGLRAALTRPVDPMPTSRAEEILNEHWTRQLGLPLQAELWRY